MSDEQQSTVIDNLDAAYAALKKGSDPAPIEDAAPALDPDVPAPELAKSNQSEEIVQWVNADDLLKETFASYDVNTGRIEKALGATVESNVLLIKALHAFDARMASVEAKLSAIAAEPGSDRAPALTATQAAELQKSAVAPQPVGDNRGLPQQQPQTSRGPSLVMRAGSMIRKAFGDEKNDMRKASLGRDVQFLESASVEFGDNLPALLPRLSSDGQEIVRSLVESAS